jgi:hypothetical protein
MLEEVGTVLQTEHQDLLHEFYYFTKIDWWVRGSRFISKLVRRDHETAH